MKKRNLLDISLANSVAESLSKEWDLHEKTSSYAP